MQAERGLQLILAATVQSLSSFSAQRKIVMISTQCTASPVCLSCSINLHCILWVALLSRESCSRCALAWLQRFPDPRAGFHNAAATAASPAPCLPCSLSFQAWAQASCAASKCMPNACQVCFGLAAGQRWLVQCEGYGVRGCKGWGCLAAQENKL